MDIVVNVIATKYTILAPRRIRKFIPKIGEVYEVAFWSY